MDYAIVLKINLHCGGKKVINISNPFLFDHKGKRLDNIKIHEKIISIVQDELKVGYVTKEMFNYTYQEKNEQQTNHKKRNAGIQRRHKSVGFNYRPVSFS